MDKFKSFVSVVCKRKLFLFAFILLFSGLLAIYGIKGLYSRYAQDDYCYGYRVQAEGFWQMQIQTYLHPTEFNSNRFSLTLVHSIVELLGGPGFMPALLILEIVAWTVGLTYVLYQLMEIIGSKKSLLIATTSALIVVFFTFYLALDQYQILFWLSAMQTYLTPTVLFTFAFGRFLFHVRSAKMSLGHAVELSLLCIIAGGFSETTSLWQFVVWGTLLVGAVLFRKRLVKAKNFLKASLITTFSALFSVIVLAACPVNFKFAFYTRPDFPTLVSQSIIFGIEFVRVSLKATPLPYLVVAVSGFWLSCLSDFSVKRRPRYLILETITIFVAIFLLSIIVMVPPEYATAHYPGGRALFPAGFTLVLCLFSLGWQVARLIASVKPQIFSLSVSKLFLSFVGVMLVVYGVRATSLVYDKMGMYRGRAEAWDIRQAMIL